MYWNIKLVPHSKNSDSFIKTSQLMMYRKIISLCSEILTKYVSTLYGQNLEMLVLNLVVRIVTAGSWWVKEHPTQMRISIYVYIPLFWTGLSNISGALSGRTWRVQECRNAQNRGRRVQCSFRLSLKYVTGHWAWVSAAGLVLCKCVWRSISICIALPYSLQWTECCPPVSTL